MEAQMHATAKTARALAAPALALALLSAGCVGLGADLLVVASAPIQSNGLTIAVVRTAGGGLGGDDTAEFEILHHGERVFPTPGVWSRLDIAEGRGTAFVPYADFVQGNGDYKVVVRDGGAEHAAHFAVSKWVSFVYLKPYVRGDTLVVDAILEGAAGGFPQDRIIAVGSLNLDIRYRGPDGGLNQTAHTMSGITTSAHKTFTRVTVPVKDMRHYKGPGYYSVSAIFDNAQARGNAWVRTDPTQAQVNPPGNWVYVNP